MRRASYPSNNRPCQPLQHAEQPPPSLVVSIREAAAGNAATRTRMHVRKGMNKHGLGHNPQVDVCIARLQIAIRCQRIDSGTEERLIDGAVGKIPTSWRHAIARVRHSMQQRGLEGGRGRRSSSGSSGDDGGSAAAAAASVRRRAAGQGRERAPVPAHRRQIPEAVVQGVAQLQTQVHGEQSHHRVDATHHGGGGGTAGGAPGLN
jgi:hypothetical protein